MTARALAAAGVRLMFGVVGIPVTPLATAAQVRGGRVIVLLIIVVFIRTRYPPTFPSARSRQAAGIRYFGMRNEQARRWNGSKA